MAKRRYGTSVRKICKHGVGIDLVVASPVIYSFIFPIQIVSFIAMRYEDIEGRGKRQLSVTGAGHLRARGRAGSREGSMEYSF